jgi:hypothetical protein
MRPSGHLTSSGSPSTSHRDDPFQPLTKELWIQFVEFFLGGIEFIGIQNCYGIREDLILFRASSSARSTLAVPFSVMLVRQEEARELVQSRIRASENSYKGAAS